MINEEASVAQKSVRSRALTCLELILPDLGSYYVK